MPKTRITIAGLVVAAGLALVGAPPAWCVSLQPGWPTTTGGLVYGSPALGDLDGDGHLEVVVGSIDGKVYAWHHDGSPVAGWPQATGDEVRGAPALADLDGDGHLEVVVGSYDRHVYAWYADGTPVTGWPQATGAAVDDSPALGDLDGDGDLEVVVGSFDHFVYAWHHDGTAVAGWPQFTGNAISSPQGSPALGDLDGDGDLEVVIGSMDYRVYAWHHDGTPVAGWPRSTSYPVDSSPAIGDTDSDGVPEVVVGSNDHNVYAWHSDGTPVAGWPKSTWGAVTSSPALGDLDGDGDPEVVVASQDTYVYAWHGNGTAVVGWPKPTFDTPDASPALGDLDGDGDLEVVEGDFSGWVHAWHGNGALVAGFPLNTDSHIRSSAALGDLDGDGDLEVVVGAWNYSVYAWTCGMTTTDPLPWPMFRHDAQRTGRYGAGPAPPLPRGLALGAVRPSSGDLRTEFTWRIKCWDQANVAPASVWVATWSALRNGPRWSPMVASDAADTDYTDGKWYEYSAYPEPGPQGYRFAVNVEGIWLYWPTPAHRYLIGPDVNPVVLSSGYVTPEAGNAATEFTYRVKYWHTGNLGPDVVWVAIWSRSSMKAAWYLMWPLDPADANYQDGRWYTLTLRWDRLDTSAHAFRFAARRGSDWAYWPVPAGNYQGGPTVGP